MSESREEILQGNEHSKMMANVRDMDIKTKWEMIDHSKIKTQTLNDYLDAIIEEHPHIYNEYFGE